MKKGGRAGRKGYRIDFIHFVDLNPVYILRKFHLSKEIQNDRIFDISRAAWINRARQAKIWAGREDRGKEERYKNIE